MRIALFSHTMAPSGAELALSRVAPYLVAEDVRVTVVHGDPDGPVTRRLTRAGVELFSVPLPSRLLHEPRDTSVSRLAGSTGEYARSVCMLAQVLRRGRFDLVHANSLKAALIITPAARLAGLPVVWHMRDQFTEAYLGRKAPAIRSFCRWTSSGVVANSHSTLATLGRYGKPVTVAYSPLSESVRPRTRPPGSGPLRVVMLGRLSPWKGQFEVVDALARVPDSWSTAVFAGAALFGEDGYAERVKAAIREKGLDGRIVLVGHVDDPGQLLAEADVLVHASVIPEPLGQVVVEGIAAGLPVCASRAGGPAELLEHEVSGLLHTPGDTAELARHLAMLAASPTLRDDLAAGGRPILARFNPQESATRILDLWRAVLAGRAPTVPAKCRSVR